MSVYSQRLWGGQELGVSGSPHVSPTVPDNYVWVIRTVIVIGRDAPDDSGVLYIVSADTPQLLIGVFTDPSLSGVVPLGVYNQRTVLEAGDYLALDVGGGLFDITVSGYALTNYS